MGSSSGTNALQRAGREAYTRSWKRTNSVSASVPSGVSMRMATASSSPVPWQPRPALSRARPERALIEVAPRPPALVESGLFEREYRDHRLESMVPSDGVDIVLDMRKGNLRFSTELA